MFKIIGADQKEYGPVSVDDIRQWVVEGRANGQTPVQQIGSTEWRALSTYPEFSTALVASPFVNTPPPFSSNTGPAPTPEEIMARDYDLDIGSCISRSWELVKDNFFPMAGITFLIWILINAVNQGISLFYRAALNDMIMNREFSPVGALLILTGILVTMPIHSVLMGGLYNYYIKMIRRDPNAGIADAFAGFTASFGQLALLGIVVGLLTIVGTALCIVPGIYLSVAWVFATALVVDKKMEFWPAMELSRKVVTRHWFMVLALLIVMVCIGLCGLIACCIGIFVTITIGWTALMYAYEDIFNRRTP